TALKPEHSLWVHGSALSSCRFVLNEIGSPFRPSRRSAARPYERASRNPHQYRVQWATPTITTGLDLGRPSKIKLRSRLTSITGTGSRPLGSGVMNHCP